MTELQSFFQSYFVNQAFLATLLLITLNNIWKKINIEGPLKIIKYVLIGSSVLFMIRFVLQYFFVTEGEDAITFLNRATGVY